MIAYHTMKNDIDRTLKTTNTYSKGAEIQSTLHSVNLDIKEAGRWFLDSRKFQHWRNSCGSLLWVYGMPGSGKTVLSASVINYLQNNPAPKNVSKVVLYYYFDIQELEKGENLRPLGCMLRSFLIQLSRTDDYMLEDLYERLRTFRGELCETSLGEILFQMTAVHWDVKIVIDALDEMEKRQRETVCGWITETLKLHPDRFSFLVTSRKETDIEEQLQQKCESLEMSANHDIKKYVLARIKEYQLNKGQRWSEESLRKIQGVLLGRANGMFRWVVCQLDQLLDHPQTESFGDDEIDEVLRILPQNLTGTYDRILDLIPKPKKKAADRLLQILLFCQRPIRVLEANEFLSVDSWGVNVSKRLKDPREVTCYCSSLVTLRESYSWDDFTPRGPYSGDSVHRLTEIVLAHSSVRDYLLFNRTLGEGQVNPFGQLAANKAIFKTCLDYVYFLSKSDANQYNQVSHSKFPLADYAGRYLFAHASAAGKDEETVDAATALCWNEDAFCTWVCHRSRKTAWNFCQKPSIHAWRDVMKASARYTAACYGLKDYLQLSLERESYHVCKVMSEQAPFGFWETDDRPKNGRRGSEYSSISPLYIAAKEGHEDVVRMLIKVGFTIDEVGGPGWMALDVACRRNCVGVVEALLENAKQRTTNTVWFESILRHAVRVGSPQLVQAFLDHGFLTHSAQPSIESAIFDAAFYGNTAVAQELLRHCRSLGPLAGPSLLLPLSPTNTPPFLAPLSAWIPDVFFWSGGGSHEHSTAQPLESYDGELDKLSKYKDFVMLLGQPVRRACLFSTALQAAAFEGHEEIVEALLKEDRDPNATGGVFGTALQAAAARGFPRVVQRLLDAGADPNTTDGFFKTALNASLMTASWATQKQSYWFWCSCRDSFWCSCRDSFWDSYRDSSWDWYEDGFWRRHRDPANYKTVVAALLKAGAQPLQGGRELRCALKLGAQEAALNIIVNATSGVGQTASEFHTKATLLRDKDEANSLLLHDAISRGFSRVVESMMRTGAAIDVLDSCRRTPLHHAMRQNNRDVALMVIQTVAQHPDAVSLLKAKDSYGMTAVHYAAWKPASSRLTMKHLLSAAKQAGILIECLDARSNRGRTALHYAPHNISDSSSRIMQLLIKAAASVGIQAAYVDVRDDRNETALHRAASFRDATGVTLLLRAGADGEAMNLDKQNFVDCAKSGRGKGHFFDVCPEAGGPFCSSMEEARAIASATLLHQFVELNDVAAVNKVAEKATFRRSFLDIPDADCGMTLLHHAAEKGYAAMVELLLDLGAWPEGVDKKKMTPLHRAAKSGCLETVTAILQRIGNEEKKKRPWTLVVYFRKDKLLTGKPSDRQDTSGSTPLHYAVQNESVEMVKSLVRCGATMHMRNKEGNTPLDLAQEKREVFLSAKIHMPRDVAAVELIEEFLGEEVKKYDDDIWA